MSIKILLVEDEPIVQMVHTAKLKRLGCDIELAENGQQAIEKSKGEYDLILMDIGLPDMRGSDVASKIRAGDKKIPIVALSGYSLVEIEKECLEAGINDKFQKPIADETFSEIIDKYTKK